MTYPWDPELEPNNRESIQENIPDNLVKLFFNIKALNLDPQANGFGLESSFDEEYAANARTLSWGFDLNHDSPTWMYWGRVNWMFSNNQNSDVLVQWYYRTCRLCSMTFDGNIMLHLANQTDIYNRNGARRIRARVFSNWRNYRVYFKKWAEDSWPPMDPWP